MPLQQITMYPVSNGKFINAAAVKRIPGSGPVYDGPWVETVTGEAAAKHFAHWDPKALGIINVRLLSLQRAAGIPRVQQIFIRDLYHRRFLTHSAGRCTLCTSCRPTSKDEPRSSEMLYVSLGPSLNFDLLIC